MPQYRKKPVVIEARQLTTENIEEVADWVADHGGDVGATLAGPDAHLHIHTLEGEMRGDPGDWIIQGVKSEFYPCKPDIFDATYEPV